MQAVNQIQSFNNLCNHAEGSWAVQTAVWDTGFGRGVGFQSNTNNGLCIV